MTAGDGPQPRTTELESSQMQQLKRLEEPAFAALRMVAGGLFSVHGMQKIFGWFSPNPGPPLGSQLWIGGMIELCAGLLIAFGLFARPAAFLSAGTMAVAYLQFHWKLQFASSQWLPAINKGELAVIYCFVFCYIAAHGAGVASLDAFLARRRGAPR